MAYEGGSLVMDSLAAAERCSLEEIQLCEGDFTTDIEHCHGSADGFETHADDDFMGILCLDESMLQLEEDILTIADDDIAGPINQLNLPAPATVDLRPLNEVPTPLPPWASEESSLSEAPRHPPVTESVLEVKASSPETPCVKSSWPFQSPPPHKRFHSSTGSHREGSPVSVLTVRLSPGRPFEGLGEPALIEYEAPNLSLRNPELSPADSCALSSKSRSKRMRIMNRVWTTDVISHVVPEEADIGSSDEFDDGGYEVPMGEIEDGRLAGLADEGNVCTTAPLVPLYPVTTGLEPQGTGLICGPGPANSDISSLTLSGADLPRSASTNQVESLVKQPSKKRKPQGSPDGKDKDGNIRRCTHCSSTTTPQWRAGPLGPKTLCNACGVRYKSGRLCPEYRPASSPEFQPEKHSNSHRKIVEMRKHREGGDGEEVSPAAGNQQVVVAPPTPSQPPKKLIKEEIADDSNVKKPKREKTEEEKERARIRRRLRKQQQKLAQQQQQQHQHLQQFQQQQQMAQSRPFFAGIGAAHTGSLIINASVPEGMGLPSVASVHSGLSSAPYAVFPSAPHTPATAPQMTPPAPYGSFRHCQYPIAPSPAPYATENVAPHCWNRSPSQESAEVLCEDEVVDWPGMEQGEEEDAEGYTSFLALDCQPLATPVLPMLDCAASASFGLAPSAA